MFSSVGADSNTHIEDGVREKAFSEEDRSEEELERKKKGAEASSTS